MLALPPPWPPAGGTGRPPPRPRALRARVSVGEQHAEPQQLRVVAETPRLLVLDKPPGLAFHADERGTPGVLQACRAAQERGDISYTGRLFGVHRLDRVTSGVLLLAKSAEDAGLVGAAFRAGAVLKYYVALSARRPSKKMGEVVGDMTPARRGAWMLLRSRGRPACTRFVSSGVTGGRPGLRGFVLRPLTGRTHQLRVALKALGAPVLGDALYADAAEAALEQRAYLHAAALRLPPLAPGEPPLAVVCAPSVGAEFCSPHFRDWFARRFPPGAPPEAWCADAPLLAAPPLPSIAWGGEDDEDAADDAAEY